MEIFLLLLFVILIASGMNAKSDAAKAKGEMLKAFGKCPPHKWEWTEIKDHEGVVHAHKLICKVCGPLKDCLDGRE